MKGFGFRRSIPSVTGLEFHEPVLEVVVVRHLAMFVQMIDEKTVMHRSRAVHLDFVS
jgi:hypothetical protein